MIALLVASLLSPWLLIPAGIVIVLVLAVDRFYPPRRRRPIVIDLEVSPARGYEDTAELSTVAVPR